MHDFFFLPLDILYPPKLRRSIHSCQGKMLGMDRENKGILVGFNSWRVGTFIRACFSNALLHQHPAAFLTLHSAKSVRDSSLTVLSFFSPSFLSSLPGLSDGGQMPHFDEEHTAVSSTQLVHPEDWHDILLYQRILQHLMTWAHATCISLFNSLHQNPKIK